MATVVSMSYLLEAGVHFGHQTKRWNPKMKEYIFSVRDDIHIIDLQQTVKKIEEAYDVLHDIIEAGGKAIFVGTKKQASSAVKEEAERAEMYYVNERWLGGTLTNFKTIKKRIGRLEEIEKMEKDGTFEKLPKKEVIKIKKEYEKLNKYLCGIREMKKIPEVMIVVDPKKEINAVLEARKLNIPIIGIVDTNNDPDDVDYVIPANDDAVRAVKVILGVLTNAIVSVNGGKVVDYINEDEKSTKDQIKETKKDVKKEEHKQEVKEEKLETKEVEKTKKEEKVDLKSLNVTELKAIAKERDVKGYSKMKKDELLEALR